MLALRSSPLSSSPERYRGTPLISSNSTSSASEAPTMRPRRRENGSTHRAMRPAQSGAGNSKRFFRRKNPIPAIGRESPLDSAKLGQESVSRQEDRVSIQESHTVAERAYLIWEQMGRPEGQALEHWLRAETELASA